MDLRCYIVFCLVIILLICPSDAEALFVNEFMPAPNDTCSQCSEWIELTSDQDEVIENISIDTGESTLTCLNDTILQGEFIIITKNASVFSGIWKPTNIKVFENSKMRLSDSSDNISILNGSNETSRIEYFNAAKNISYGLCGKTLVRQNISTPGLPNICVSEANQTANQTNATDGECNMSINIESEEIFVAGKSNSFRLVVKNLNGTENAAEVEYWIEDFFGNILKSKTKTNNTATVKSWTPPALTGTEGYKINVIITDAKCNDTNVSNNHAEKIIVVEGDMPVSDSSISIIDAGLGSDGKVRFGDEIEVRVNIHKGDTAKNAVEMRIEDTEGRKAGKTTFNIYTKFSNYTISVPLQINPNCDNVLPNGTYFIKIEGLNGSDEKQITIEGSSNSFCKIKTVETEKTCSSSACPPYQKTNNSEKPNELSKDFEIISCPDEIAKNAELAIELLLKVSQEKNFTIYSYIYDGNKPLSLGFDGKKWLNTWNANKVEVTARNSTTVDLKNRISNDTVLGRYKLRIKIIYDGKEHDITRDILVREPSEEMQQKTGGQDSGQTNETLEKENATNNKNENLKEKQIKTPTGSLVSKKEDNWFSAAINGVINFFKNLFKL